MDDRNLPREPFRYDALEGLGLTRQRLRRLVREGAIRRVIRGVYAAADLADTQELRIAAVSLGRAAAARRAGSTLCYPNHRIAIEYNGWDAHERTPEQKAYDEARLEWLVRNGWSVIVIEVGDFTGDAPSRWLGEIREALRPSYSNVRRMECGSKTRG